MQVTVKLATREGAAHISGILAGFTLLAKRGELTLRVLDARQGSPIAREALLPSLACLTGAVLLIAVAGYAVDAVYQRFYRLLRLPALETKLDALTACILQRIVGGEKA